MDGTTPVEIRHPTLFISLEQYNGMLSKGGTVTPKPRKKNIEAMHRLFKQLEK